MHKDLTKRIIVVVFTVLILVLFGFIAFSPKDVLENNYNFTKASKNTEHPYLLTSDNERTLLQKKVESDHNLKNTLDSIKTQPSGLWHQKLIEYAFYQFLTGDAPIREKAISLLKQYTLSKDKFDFDSTFKTGSGNKYYYSQQCTSLILSYDFLYPYLTPQDREAMKKFFIDWGVGLFYYYTPKMKVSHNFHTGSVACMGLIGLAFYDDAKYAKSWVELAYDSFTQYYINWSWNPGGDYIEGYHYQHYGSGPAILFAQAYKRFMNKDFVDGSNFSKMWNFYIYSFMANKRPPAYGDNTGGYIITGEDLAMIKYLPSDKQSTALWIWQQLRGPNGTIKKADKNWGTFDKMSIVLYYPYDLTPKPPEINKTAESLYIFKSQMEGEGIYQGKINNPGGMASFHTGWDSNNSVSLWFINRWRWQNHQHYDPNTFHLFAYGNALFSSENYRDYKDPLRGKLSQQNTVRIDPNAPYGDMPHTDFYTGMGSALGRFIESHSNNLIDSLTSDAKYPMANFSKFKFPKCEGCFGYMTAEEKYVTPIEKATRTTILVKSLLNYPFVIIFDEYQKDSQTKPQYLWQAYVPSTTKNMAGKGTPEAPFIHTVGQTKAQTLFLSNIPFELSTSNVEGRKDKIVKVLTNKSDKPLILATLILPETSGIDFSIEKLSDTNGIRVKDSSGQECSIFFNPQHSYINKYGVQTNALLTAINFKTNDWLTIGGSDLKINDKSIQLKNYVNSTEGHTVVPPAYTSPTPTLPNITISTSTTPTISPTVSLNTAVYKCEPNSNITIHTGANYSKELIKIPTQEISGTISDLIKQTEYIYTGSCKSMNISDNVNDKTIVVTPDANYKAMQFKITLENRKQNDNPLIKMVVSDQIFYGVSDIQGNVIFQLPTSLDFDKVQNITIEPLYYAPITISSSLNNLNNTEVTDNNLIFKWGNFETKNTPSLITAADYAVFSALYNNQKLAADGDGSQTIWIRDYSLFLSNINE